MTTWYRECPNHSHFARKSDADQTMGYIMCLGYTTRDYSEFIKKASMDTQLRSIMNLQKQQPQNQGWCQTYAPLQGFDERHRGKKYTPIVSECYQAKETRNTTVGSISLRIRIINFLDHSAKQTWKVEDVLQGYAHARKHDKECFSLSRPYLKQHTGEVKQWMFARCCTLTPLELVKIDRLPLRIFPFAWPLSLLTRHLLKFNDQSSEDAGINL